MLSLYESGKLEMPVANYDEPIRKIDTPCIRRCCLDEHDVCLGCFRTLDDIKGWTSSLNIERRAILARAADRKATHDKTYGSFDSLT